MGDRVHAMERLNRVVSHLAPENASFADSVPLAPPDAIFGINNAFKTDNDPRKVNVCVGAFRSDDGKPYVLPCVKAAQAKIAGQNNNLEYLPQRGDQEFAKLSREVLMGTEVPAIKEDRVASVQSISGTGALRQHSNMGYTQQHPQARRCASQDLQVLGPGHSWPQLRWDAQRH